MTIQVPQSFRHCPLHGPAMTILKIIPEEAFQQSFEQWRNTDSINVAV
jgi:hypothetical protein